MSNVIRFGGRPPLRSGNGPRCEIRLYWTPAPMPSDRESGLVGVCQRYPPPTIADADVAASIDDTTSPFTGFFPETMSVEWCGEFKSVVS
jgi:hypothetical protein